MSVENFIPTLWAGTLLENLNAAHVATDCVNRDYEGEIKEAGDVVKINAIGRVTITAYVKNTPMSAPEELQDAGMYLNIDQLNQYHFQIDDVDRAQINVELMQEAMKEAAWGLADDSDQFLIALINAGVASAAPDNVMTTRAIGTGAGDEDAYETLVDLAVLLDESEAPSGDRWCMIPPWIHGMLLKDPRFVSFGTKENIARLVRGSVGEAAGFTIKSTNNIYPALSSAYAMIAGYKGAATYAEQILKTEAYRPELLFSDAMKGLHVFGAKVTRPYALATCPVTVA